MSVSLRSRNRFGYLSHSLVCLSSVSWHTYGIESSVWLIQDLPRPSLHHFVSFTTSWSGLWGFSTALKCSLTCSTSCLVCNGGRSSMNLVVSVGVSLVIHLFFFFSSFFFFLLFSFWGYTSGGVYVLYIYWHSRWEATPVFVVVLWRLSSASNSLACWFCMSALGLVLFHIVSFSEHPDPPTSLRLCFILFGTGYLLTRGLIQVVFALRLFLVKPPSTFQNFLIFTLLPGSSALLQIHECSDCHPSAQRPVVSALSLIRLSYPEPATPRFCPSFFLCQRERERAVCRRNERLRPVRVRRSQNPLLLTMHLKESLYVTCLWQKRHQQRLTIRVSTSHHILGGRASV